MSLLKAGKSAPFVMGNTVFMLDFACLCMHVELSNSGMQLLCVMLRPARINTQRENGNAPL